MKKLLIIKTGTTHTSIQEKIGDFDSLILNQISKPVPNVVIIPVYQQRVLPGLDDISAVIVTGSHSMVTNRDHWSLYTSQWLKLAAQNNIPVLGICYGHQLIAQTFGGMVGYHPEGIELGTVHIELTDEGQADPLLGSLPSDFLGHVAHRQTVLKLPPTARILAKNNYEPHHAFCINTNIWGVQFHPEFNAQTVRMYIEKEQDILQKEGYNIDRLYHSIKENDYGKVVLNRFIELAGKE